MYGSPDQELKQSCPGKSSLKKVAQKAAALIKDIERLANLNKRRRTHQLTLVTDQNYNAFIDTIFYDSDEEFSVTTGVKELDVR